MADINDSRNLERKVAAERGRLRASDANPDDYQAIVNFCNYRQGRVSRNTFRQDMGNLRRAGELASGSLVEFTRRSDIDDVMRKLGAQGATNARTKNAYLRSIRQFFKWLSAEPGFPEYEWIDDVESYQVDKESRRLKKEAYLSESEVTQLREAATHPREENLVEFLADTGARINLVCNLRRKDISLDGKHPTFRPNPNAKDGYKGVAIKHYPVHYCERDLRKWMNKSHPDKHPDAPLFPKKHNYDTSDRGSGALHPQSALNAVKSLVDKTDIDTERVSPHAFRHAAVRRMKTDPNFDFDWETVKMRTAWSDRAFESMKELYGALEAGEQLDYFADRAGRETDSPETDEPSLFDDCPHCGEENRRDARFCDRCGREMSEEGKRLREQSESRVVEVENEQEGEIVQAILKDLRENPSEYLDD